MHFRTQAKAIVMLADFAHLHGLPEPMSTQAPGYSKHIDLQFDTRDEVDAWAQMLDEARIDDSFEPQYWILGSIHEVDVRLVSAQSAPFYAAARECRGGAA